MSATQQTPNLPTEPEVQEEPKPFEITGTPETGFELRYADTGEVFKGKTERELLEANAKSKLETSLSWRELKHELEEIKTQQERVAQALQPPPPQPTPAEVEQSQMDDYIFGAFSRKLGRTPEAVVTGLHEMEEQAAENKKRATVAAFLQACPDFPQTKEAGDKIEQWLKENGIPEERLTLSNLKSAHATCVQFGAYKPLTQDELNAHYQRMGQPQASTVAARAQAPPTLPTGQPEMTGARNLWDMKPEEIRKDFFDRFSRGER